jgi:hypothetical protein
MIVSGHSWGFMDIPNATDSVLSFSTVAFTDSGKYECLVTNGGYAIYSDLANLSVSSLNTIQNGGFENGQSSWTMDAPNVSLTTTDKYSGTTSTKFTATGGTWKNCMQLINVTPGTNYTLSFWMKGDGIGVQIQTTTNSFVYDPSSTTPGIFGNGINGTSTWTKYTFTFNSGASSQLKVDFLARETSTLTYVDDITIY